MNMGIARRSFGSLAAGCATGGLVVGLAEALYREVALVYAAFLYGACWSIAGLGLGLALRLLFRKGPQGSLFGHGFALATASSAFVLVRFIVLRDVLHEAPGSNLKATAAGAAFAVVLGLLLYGLTRSGKKVFSSEGVPRGISWAVPGAVLLIFALLTQTGDDVFPGPTRDSTDAALEGSGVVLLVIDTLRADMLGAYGAPPHREGAATPTLDALASRGAVFEDVSAQASWTRPAVASLLTSRHVTGHQTMSKVARLPDELPTLAETLAEEGVKTAAVVTNYNLEPGYGFDQGFEHYQYLAPARYLGAPPRANRLAAYNVYRLLREKIITAGREARFFYRSGLTVNSTGLKALDAIGNDRFFLYLHYMEPHDPYFGDDGDSYARVSTVHPDPTLKDSIVRAYRDEVRRIDDILGQLLEQLEARGLRDRVTVLVTADHGEEFLDHGGWWHGETLYQEQIKVPFIVAGPTVTPAVISHPVRQIDIAPTITRLYGIDQPESWEGHDALDPDYENTSILAEEDHNGNVLTAFRNGQLKLITANDGNPRGLPTQQLFDLSSDPEEQDSLSLPPRARELAEQRAAAIKRAALGGASGESRELTAEQEAELRALGYMQ